MLFSVISFIYKRIIYFIIMALKYLQYKFLKYAFIFSDIYSAQHIFFSFLAIEIRHSLDEYLIDVSS